MSPEREIFCAALERRSTGGRAAYLAEACAGEPAARARVEALLQAAEAAGEFLDGGEAPVTETTGSRIDRYRLAERLGEGGFGLVYRAEQLEPVRRSVALKITKLGMDTRAVIARFEAERQALALMDHPHIAQVFDGGATPSGRPYFVMELVAGVPLTTFCNEHRLRIRDRVELFLQVCRAVHHAHQRGVIHRDLKPSNILVANPEGRPTAKVIDFGIAKATRVRLSEHTGLTGHAAWLGTPAYMSPEQVGGDIDVDTRCDIYSLGALLYEVLADVTVLDGHLLRSGRWAEVQEAVRTVEALPPSQRVATLPEDQRASAAARRACAPERLAAELRGDLDWVVLKCLEKDRDRRYGTTEALARDLERYLRHEPVQARRPTIAYRATKFVRRHRTAVSVAGSVLLLLGGTAVVHTHRLSVERDRARASARQAAKVSELLTELLVSGDPFRTPTAKGALDSSAERVRREFPGQPEVRLEILNAIGRVYLRRGEHAKARPVLEEALAAGREVGRPDVQLAQTLSDLGILRRETGEVEGSLPYLTEALAMRRQLRGPDHNEVAISLVELSRSYSSLERLDEAEALSREALAIRRRVLGEPHREVAVSLGDVAVLLWQKGDLAAADPFFAQSLAMHRATVGPHHPNVAQAMANWAQLQADQGHLDAAEELLRQGLPIFRQSFGEKHWRVATALGHLAFVLRLQGRRAEAAQLLDQALPMARASLGEDRPQSALLLLERGRLYLEAGDAAAAEPLVREALRIQLLSYREDGWRVASTRSVLGGVLLALGRRADAEPLLAQASQVLPEMPGPRGRETGPTRERWAELRERSSARVAEL